MDSLTVEVATEPRYPVHVGRDLLAAAGARAAEHARWALLSDEHVAPLYAARVLGASGAPSIVVAPGEASKSLGVVERVLDELVALGLDRRSCLVALGGGVVGDLGGLVASLFMRGIDVIQVPTSLLAQVDSSVGGKTGVNLRGGKNLAGTFHQPSAVFADTTTIATLSEDELASGLGEVVKTAMLAGESAFRLVEESAEELLARDPDALARAVELCVRTKADVVARDEREAGPRKALNLGHTFAHAVEHAAGYGTVPHGVAVACGLALATRYSERTGVLEDAGLPVRVERLLERLGLPCDLAALRARSGAPLAAGELVEGMSHDKKGAAGEPRFVLPAALGRVELDVPATREEVAGFLAEAAGAR